MLCILAPWAQKVTAQDSAFSGVLFEGNGQVVQLEGGGRDFCFTGSGNIVEITGRAGAITIDGAGNVLNVNTAHSLTLEGSGNEVTVLDTPHIYLRGSANRVDFAGSPRLVEAGFNNFATPLPSHAAEPATGLKVVELFTSQGCWSCPPADQYHAELTEQPGLLTLSYHVDYWDGVAWHDPLASPQFTDHQKAYRDAFKAPAVYTPQMILNGWHALVGSNNVLGDYLLRHLPALPRQLSLQAGRRGDSAQISWSLNRDTEDLRLKLVLVQERVVIKPTGGENGGKELLHINVVRSLRWLPATPSGEITLNIPEELREQPISVALLAHRAGSFEVVTAAQTKLR